MWCVLYVRDGNEERTEAFLERFLPEDLNIRCFHLTRSRKKKYGGQWRTVQENLLPGYVFIETAWPEAVHRKLKKIVGNSLLCSSDEFVRTLEWQEAEFLEQITDQSGRIGLSSVCISSDGRIQYLSGPLTNVISLVKRVDLHRRTAEVEMDFLGKKCVLYLGVDIQEGGKSPKYLSLKTQKNLEWMREG